MVVMDVVVVSELAKTATLCTLIRNRIPNPDKHSHRATTPKSTSTVTTTSTLITKTASGAFWRAGELQLCETPWANVIALHAATNNEGLLADVKSVS